MNFNNLPSKKEVMGWNPQSLADYMRKLNLSGCDKAVIKSSMSGAQFMKMAECDLHIFPILFVPVISKIQSQIIKGDQKKAFGQKPKTQRFPQQAFEQEEEVWDSDEFDNESDREDEAPHQDGVGDNYICSLTESQDVEEVSSDEYEIPSKDPVKLPQYPRVAKHCDSNYRDSVNGPTPAERILRPPQPCPKKTNDASKRPPKPPASQPSRPVDRSKKPGQSGSSKNDPQKSKGSNIKSFSSSFRKAPKPKPPKSTEVASKSSKPKSKATPPPPAPLESVKINSPLPEPKESIPDLDPGWYRGQMTRHQAEAALREVNQDGAFLVRDSSKSSEEHPYTLMLLKQDKVFNIKIRNQGNSYSLGNGLNNKSFPGVREMITHHAHTPLLLIDATDQSSEAQNHCCLLHPAGL